MGQRKYENHRYLECRSGDFREYLIFRDLKYSNVGYNPKSIIFEVTSEVYLDFNRDQTDIAHLL